MILTKNALGNLRSRYKAVLEKCRLLNIFGALALAGALGLGGAGQAAAADWGPDKNVVITGAETESAARQAHSLNISGAGNSLTYAGLAGGGAGQLFIADMLTVAAGGALVVNHADHAGIQGALDHDAAAAGQYTGSLAVSGDASELTINGSQLQMNGVEISGGRVAISGQAVSGSNNWDDGAMLVGGLGGAALNVTGGTVAVGESGQLVGGQVNVSGGEVRLNGENNKEALLRAYGDQSLNLLDGGKISVAAGKKGALSASAVAMSGGALDVQGTLTVTGPLRKGQSLAQALKTSGATRVEINGGTATVAKGGDLYAPRAQINQSGGSLIVNGTLWTDLADGSAGGAAGDFDYPDSGYALSGGKLTVTGDLSPNGTAGQINGDMQVGNLSISGGNVEISATATPSAWDNGARLGGYGVNNQGRTDISGGTVTLGNNSVLFAGVEAWNGGESGQMNLSNHARIVMDGTDAVLYAASPDDSTAGHVTLNVRDKANITVTAGKSGYILARNTVLDGGSIDVAGALTVAGKSQKGDTVAAGLGGAGLGGAFTLSDGAVNVAQGGKLNFADGKVDVSLNGGAFNYNGGASGQLAFNSLNVQGGALNAVADLSVGGAAATGASVADRLVVGGERSGSLSLESLTQTGGSVAVNNGTLTVGALDQSGGAITVGGAGADGTLSVTGATAGTSLKTFGVTVGNLGTLAVQSAATGAFAGDTFAKNAAVAVTTVNAGGVLQVNGFDALNTAQLGSLKTALISGTGLLDVGNARIDIVPDTDGSLAYADVQGVSSDALRQVTVKTDTTTAAGGVSGGFKDLLVEDAEPGTDKVVVAGTLQLAGSSAGGNLLKGAASGAGAPLDLEVGVNSVATLGASGMAHAGAVGDVTLNSAGRLNALGDGGASFTTGAVEGAADNEGHVNASGALLTAESIGKSHVVKEINTVNGAVISRDVIKTQYLSAAQGVVQALGDISAAEAVTDLRDGVIRSTGGNVTLSKGANGVSGAILADMGDITATGQNITAADNGALTLAAGKSIMAQDIRATSLTAQTLTATGNVSLRNGALTLAHTAAASTIDGTLGLTNVTADVRQLTVAGAATVDGGSLTAAGLSLGAGGTLTNGAQVTVDALTLGGTLNVGTSADTQATSLVAAEVDLTHGRLVFDPAWTAPAASSAVGSVVGGLDAAVLQNNMVTFGTTDKAWLHSHVAALGGLKQNGITAALGIYTPQVLKTGGELLVNGNINAAPVSTPDTAGFAADSLLVVRADAARDPAGALSAGAATAVRVDDKARLRISGAEVGEKYTVLGNNMKDANLSIDKGWSGENFSTDSLMVGGGAFDAATGSITTRLNSAHAVYPMLDGELADLLDAGYVRREIGGAHLDAAAAGARLLSRATNIGYMGENRALAAKTIESAARMAVAGAVPQMTMSAANAAGNAVTQRTSLAQPAGNGIQSMARDGSLQSGASAGDASQSGFAMWIMPLYQSQNGWGMKAGDNYNLDFHGGLGGVALGADYTFDNALRAGITFNIGGGYAQGSGDLASTTNNMNFWGIGAYAGWSENNFGLTADVNYISTYNKLEQDLPAALDMGSKLKSDITAYAVSAGLRGEYKFQTSALDITPHLGVRYMSLNTDEYDVKAMGTVLKGDAIRQNIWTFPLGVSFSKQIDAGKGWRFKPSLDLAVIPAAGDMKARSEIRFTGVSGTAGLDTQVMDYVSYMGQAGLEFGNDQASFGVNYQLQAGEKTTAHGVFGTFRYEF